MFSMSETSWYIHRFEIHLSCIKYKCMVYGMDKELERLRSQLDETIHQIDKTRPSGNVLTLEEVKSEREQAQNLEDLKRLRNILIDQINARQSQLQQAQKLEAVKAASKRVESAADELRGICDEMSELVERHKELMTQALTISRQRVSDYRMITSHKNMGMVTADPRIARGFTPMTTMIYPSSDRHQFYVRSEALTNA